MIHDRISPALAQGEVVVLDRFWYSTVAYQCFGLGITALCGAASHRFG